MWIKNEGILVNTDEVQILYMSYSNGVWKILADSSILERYAEKETCKEVFEGITKALRDGRGFYDMKEVFRKRIAPVLVSED